METQNKFNIEIKIWNKHKNEYEWKKLHSSGSITPYEYETFSEASKIAQMCYPDNQDDVRIVKA